MLHMTVVELKPLMGAWIFSSAFEKGLFSIHTIYSTFEMAEKGTWHKKPQFGIYSQCLHFPSSYHIISTDYEIVEKGIWH